MESNAFQFSRKGWLGQLTLLPFHQCNYLSTRPHCALLGTFNKTSAVKYLAFASPTTDKKFCSSYSRSENPQQFNGNSRHSSLAFFHKHNGSHGKYSRASFSSTASLMVVSALACYLNSEEEEEKIEPDMKEGISSSEGNKKEQNRSSIAECEEVTNIDRKSKLLKDI